MNMNPYNRLSNFNSWDELEDQMNSMTKEDIINMSIAYYKENNMDNEMADERAKHDFTWFYQDRDNMTTKTLNFLSEQETVNIFYQVPKEIGEKIISFL